MFLLDELLILAKSFKRQYIENLEPEIVDENKD